MLTSSEEKIVCPPPHPCIKQCIKVGGDKPHTETGKLQHSNSGVARSVRFRNERTLLQAKYMID